MTPANQQDDESKYDDDSFLENDWMEYFSEKKQVPKIPIMVNKERMKKIIPFSEWFPKLKDPVLISRQIIEDIAKLGNQINQIWNKFLEIIKIEPRYLVEFLWFEYEIRTWGKWGESIYRKVVDVDEFAYPTDEHIGDIHKELLSLRWESNY